MSKTKILITGGSGLLALNWALFCKNDYEVVLALNKRQISIPGVSCVKMDHSSYEGALQQIEKEKPDIIVHTAGLTSVELCENNPELAYAVNTIMAENIARVCALLSVKLIHISTDHLFTGDIANADENLTPSPVNIYGKTKMLAEIAVLNCKPDALVIRTNFYGWGPSYRNSFSDTILNMLRRESEISLFNDVHFTPILIDTLVHSVHQLIEMNQRGIFNVVGDERITKYEFGIYIAEEFKLKKNMIRPINFSDKKDLIKRPLDLSLSNKKVSLLLNQQIGNVRAQLNKLHLQENMKDIIQIRSL